MAVTWPKNEAAWERSKPLLAAWFDGSCGKSGRYWEPRINPETDPIAYIESLNETKIALKSNRPKEWKDA